MREIAHAKVNIFLKMVGTRGHYHTFLSRFMRVESLYDTMSIEKKANMDETFSLIGDFGCTLEQNTIYKAYRLLQEHSPKVGDFFKTHTVKVEKKIPEFAGLGGGSSNAAAFLRLTNRLLNLGIKTKDLADIGAKIGADVPFFVYNYASANVSGIGDIVEPFEEDLIMIETFTPPILCDTGKVYQQFRNHYLNAIDVKKAQAIFLQPSALLLHKYKAPFLNDLFQPAVDLYPALLDYHDNNFFSGSGSTFFRSDDG